MQNKQGLFGINAFTKAFEKFDEEAFFQDLHNRVKNKSYFEQYQGFKSTVVWLSYLFNAASALTASYAVYWLTNKITGISAISWLVAIIFLFFLEKIKRKSSSEFWQQLFFRQKFAKGWFGLSMFCLLVSLVSSGFGVKEGTENLSPDAELLFSDSLANEYQGKIALLQVENEEFKKQRNHEGVIYHRTQASIKENKKMISGYQVRVLELEKKLEGKNELLSEEYSEEVKLTAWTLVYLTLLMELLFEACIAYIWYYYFRSYVERQKTKEVQIEPPQKIDKDIAAELANNIKSLKEELSVLKHQKTILHTDTSQNGLNGAKSIQNNSKMPIGFYSKKQFAEINGNISEYPETQNPISSVKYDDKYTVEHTYLRGNSQKSVRYTISMINARVKQYSRTLDEAKDRKMSADIIANRNKWLEYWQGKQVELEAKRYLKT